MRLKYSLLATPARRGDPAPHQGDRRRRRRPGRTAGGAQRQSADFRWCQTPSSEATSKRPVGFPRAAIRRRSPSSARLRRSDRQRRRRGGSRSWNRVPSSEVRSRWSRSRWRIPPPSSKLAKRRERTRRGLAASLRNRGVASARAGSRPRQAELTEGSEDPQTQGASAGARGEVQPCQGASRSLGRVLAGPKSVSEAAMRLVVAVSASFA